MRSVLIVVILGLTLNIPAQQLQLHRSSSNSGTDPMSPHALGKIQRLLEDWPQLRRYREADAKLGTPKPGEQRVVFLGDSITDRWGKAYGRFFPGKPYVNRGIVGQTTPQMLIRFQQDVIDLQPSVVVILAGINDIAGNTGPESMEDIENNFKSMVMLAKSAHIRVVLCSVLPASSLPWNPIVNPSNKIRELNAWLADYALNQNITFLNYYPALVNSSGGMQENLAADKAVHPNDAGYAIMSPLAERAIEKALATPRP